MTIITGILVGLALYFILADTLGLPTMRASRAIYNLSKNQAKGMVGLELGIHKLAVRLSKWVRINEFKRLQLVSDLQTAGLNISPELHIAKGLVVGLAAGMTAIPFFFIFPILSPVFIILGFMVYLKEIGSVRERIKDKRSAIEFELPRFVAFIEKTLQHNRSVLSILEDYRKSTVKEFQHELNITVADMHSGNYEAALTRLEGRVGSPMLSDVIRGLISVIQGDETDMYWTVLSVRFADIGRQMLRQRALKVPPKVKRLSMSLLFCFMMSYVVIIVVEVLSSMSAMFGGG
ncbi:MAG: secretion protein F [Oscillospiraceae bacterium]|nr:secretion protein F [Oscillospiraceae bacterium]